jgi:HSP20 family molecular chaperone IbpA
VDKLAQKFGFKSGANFSSSFEKGILLPEDVDDGDIKASFKDGLLNIELAKSDHPVKFTMEISIH